MTILLDPRLAVNFDESEPTALDRDYAASTSPFADLDLQADEPTPAAALAEPGDEDFDEGPDMGAWWDWMGPDPDLDDRWSLTIAGGAGSRSAWAAEGRARLRACGSTRGDLFGRDAGPDA